MATPSDRPRKKRNFTNISDDLSTPERLERNEKMMKCYTERDEAVRALLTCKICFRLLYEPFTNECGHTYCYTCLCSWFKNAPLGKKTCPDCRKRLVHAPSPAYALRELVREMTSRPDLLPLDESVDGHDQLQKEETSALEMDKAEALSTGGGLFSGDFKAPTSRSTIHDMADGVHRCPACAWELDEGLEECQRCGAILHSSDFASDSNLEIDDDLLDYDEGDFRESIVTWIDGEEGYNESESSESESMPPRRRFPYSTSSVNRHSVNARRGPVLSGELERLWAAEEEDEEEDLEYDSSMDGFVVNDYDNDEGEETDDNDEDDEDEGQDEDNASHDDSDASSETSHQNSQRQRSRISSRLRHTVEDSDHEEEAATTVASEDGPANDSRLSPVGRTNAIPGHDDNSSSDTGHRRRLIRRGRRPIVISEDSAEESNASAD